MRAGANWLRDRPPGRPGPGDKNYDMRAPSVCLASLLAGLLLVRPADGAPTQAELRARLESVIVTLRGDDIAKAHAELESLLADAAASGDRKLLGEILIQQAYAHFRSASYPNSFATYERALVEVRAARERRLEARTLWGMAQVRKNQGRYAEALKLNVEARTLYVAVADSGGEMRAWLLEGALLDLTGEHRVALESYERARVLTKEGERNYAMVFGEMGISYKNLGEYARAREMYEAAIREHRRIGWKYGEAMSLGALGTLSATLGDYDAGVRQIEEALAILREVGDARGQTYALGSLGDVWWAREEGKRAAEAWQQQLEVARKLDMRQPQALALAGLGEVALAAGDFGHARDYFRRALEIERADSGSREANLLVALANTEWRASNPRAAAEFAAEALVLAQAAENPEAQWQARLALGRAASDPQQALAHLRAGVDVVSSVRGRLLTDSGKVGYLDIRQQLFHELVATLTRESRTLEALEVAEAARGRAFSDLLAARSRGAGADRSTAIAQLRDEEARLRAQAGSAAREPELRAELARTRAATEARIDSRLEALRGQHHELASLVVAEPVSAAEITATSERLRATIVEYLVTRERLYIWVVSPGAPPHSTSVALDSRRLRDTVRELHRAFNGLDAQALRNPAPVRKLLRELHGWVIEPIASRLPRGSGDLVLLIPHDALFMVPFGALEDSNGRSLLASHTLASAPSIATLRYTAQKKRQASGLGGARLLALADPTVPQDAAMEPLPGARDEVRQISQRFDADRRLALEGVEASEKNAKTLSGGQTVLHFAVHGLVRDDRPWDSALVLAPGNGEDGWLRVSELFDLRLDADLVVLSGCSTGAGKLSGDGILGLGRAFIYAGTPTVVVSQWDVSDVATAFLMQRFYAELHAGRTKAQALRIAQLAAQKRFQHPALWAAFVLIGEPT